MQRRGGHSLALPDSSSPPYFCLSRCAACGFGKTLSLAGILWKRIDKAGIGRVMAICRGRRQCLECEWLNVMK